MTTSTQPHTITVVTHSNGAPAKTRRAVCSCGFLGARFAYFPTQAGSIAKATAKAEADGAEHTGECA